MAGFGSQFKTVQTGTITLDGSGDGTDTLGTAVSAVDKAWVELNPAGQASQGVTTAGVAANCISIYISATNTVTVNAGTNWANSIISYIVFEIY